MQAHRFHESQVETSAEKYARLKFTMDSEELLNRGICYEEKFYFQVDTKPPPASTDPSLPIRDRYVYCSFEVGFVRARLIMENMPSHQYIKAFAGKSWRER